MSFIPSFLKSAPQIVSLSMADTEATKDAIIASVDLNNSALVLLGSHGDEASGFPDGSNFAYVDFVDATTIRAHRSVTHLDLDISVLVIEFLGFFLRQAIHFQSSSGAHGLTLGTKAFPLLSGWSSTWDAPVSGPIATGELLARITLDATNVNWFNGSTVDKVGAFVVDPK